MIHQLSRQLFQIYVFNRRIFANAVDELDTMLMPELYAALTPPLPDIRRKTNQFSDLHGDEPTDQTIEWKIKSLEDHFKSRISPTKTSTVVSAITGRLNIHAIGDGDVEVHPS